MSIPDSSHPVWRDIVTGKVKYEFEFLATRILLGRMVLDIERDSSPERVHTCAEELRDLMAKNVRLPSAQRDLKKIFGAEVTL